MNFDEKNQNLKFDKVKQKKKMVQVVGIKNALYIF
jgi:hypothetical protein